MSEIIHRRRRVLLYGHIVEASEPYETLANLVDIAARGQFLGWRFPDEGTRPQPVGRKIESIAEQAATVGMPTVADPFNEVFDRVFHNGIFHADYSLHAARFDCRATGVPTPTRT